MREGDATKSTSRNRDFIATYKASALISRWRPPLALHFMTLSILIASGCSTGRWTRLNSRSQASHDHPIGVAVAPVEGNDFRKPTDSSPIVHHMAAKPKSSESARISDVNPRLLDTDGPEFLRWAYENLQSGDICFSMSDARAIFGLFPFSRIVIKMTDSRFSHTAIVSREADGIYVYDAAPGGPRRTDLAKYMQLQGKHAFAIKRLRSDLRHSSNSSREQTIQSAIAYCQGVFQRGGDFDVAFAPDDERYYCVELTQKAYAAGGVELSKPVRIDRFPRYGEFPLLTTLGPLVTKIRTDRGIFIPGNDSMGVWASPDLELVYDNGEPGLVKR